mmetsp:Transcript_43707/g.140370  ORF Transcript_43707/g.140370 Transcript_43707/m.140370 type:complete len:309 (+) Transcript_43707:248-1174(+)
MLSVPVGAPVRAAPGARQHRQQRRLHLQRVGPGVGLRGRPSQHDLRRQQAGGGGVRHALCGQVGRRDGDATAHAARSRVQQHVRLLPARKRLLDQGRGRALPQRAAARLRGDGRGRRLPQPLHGPLRGERNLGILLRRRARRGGPLLRLPRVDGARPALLRGGALQAAVGRSHPGARRGQAALPLPRIPRPAHAAASAATLPRRRRRRRRAVPLRRRVSVDVLGAGEVHGRHCGCARRRAQGAGHVEQHALRFRVGQRRPNLPAGRRKQPPAEGRKVLGLGRRRAGERLPCGWRAAARGCRHGVRRPL